MKKYITLFLAGILIAFTPLYGQPESGRRPKVALALAGGGALGFAHIGVIKVLEELGIPVDIVTGTSMGAIVGGLYSIGYNPEEIKDIVNETNWIETFTEYGEISNELYLDKIDRSRYFIQTRFDEKGFYTSGGVLSGKKVMHLLDSLTLPVSSPVDFDSLPRRFRAVSVDILSGKRIIHEAGSIPDAMRSSMSIPGVFSPYHLNGLYHVDGMLSDNLPVDLARDLGADFVIAVDLRDCSKIDPDAISRSAIKILSRSLDIMVRNTMDPQLANADLVITVDTQGYSTADFMKAREIHALGEKTARMNAEDILLFKTKNGLGNQESDRVQRAAMPMIDSIRIEGGTDKDRVYARTLFERFVGTRPLPSDLKAIFEEIDRDGRCDTVRIRLDASGSESILIVSVTSKDPIEFSIRFSLLSESTYSRYLVNALTISPGVALRGIPFENTRITLDTELLDSPGFDAAVRQPFLGRFSAGAFYSLHSVYETWLADSDRGYQERSFTSTGGIRLTADTFTFGEFSVAVSQDWIDGEHYEDVVAGDSVETAICLHADYSLRKCDSPIFPHYGILATIKYLYSAPLLESQRAFSTIKTSGGVFIPAGDYLSVGFRWIAGTDFSVFPDSLISAPAYYKPNLANRQLFPGLLTTKERIGSHILGGGIFLQYTINAESATRSLPVNALLQVSAGTVINDTREFAQTHDSLHFTGALGAGMRINDAFGISIRGGICRNTDAEYLPFFSLDLGAIGY